MCSGWTFSFRRGHGPWTKSRAQLLFKRFEQYGLRDVCALLVMEPKAEPDLRTARAYGASTRWLAEFFRTADLLWNFAAGVKPPLLSRFRHRVLVDGDPGHLQASAQTWDLGSSITRRS
jgi:hypothetical protein